LLRRELLLDAEDRAALENELRRMGVNYRIEKHIVVPTVAGTATGGFGRAQKIISGLSTTLRYFNTHEPSLEDAYVELIEQKSQQKEMRDVAATGGI
jgi:hypothetical protein